MEAKQNIRRQMRAARAALTDEQRASASHAICRQLVQSQLQRFGSRIAVYLAKSPEADVDAFARRLLEKDITVFAPCHGPHGEPAVARLHNLTDVQLGAFGVREPRKSEILNVGDLDCILVPGLAFDRRGGRIGQGGGWYDRVLRKRSEGKPLAIGIGFDFQLVDEVPRQQHDQSVDAVVTPSHVVDVGGFLAPTAMLDFGSLGV